MMPSLCYWLIGLLLAPLFLGVINKTKAVVAGRKGAPLLQGYYDLTKLFHKGAVYSRTTTVVFCAGPIIGLSAVGMASLMVPVGGVPALILFPGDLIVFAYLLGLARFFTVLAALDTGSSFEGMGGSREVWISIMAEPVMFLAFGALARQTGAWSLSGIIAGLIPAAWPGNLPITLLLGLALFIVVLAENSRIPVDDPNTHLELTMIHEVMVLDHSGIDLGFILYSASIKLWITGIVLMNVVFPIRTGFVWIDGAIGIVTMAILAVGVGLIESSMARLRLTRIPQLMVGAIALAAIALILTLRGV